MKMLLPYVLSATLAMGSLQGATPQPPPLTPDMARHVVLTWYAGTNDHKPVEQLLMLLADDVEMRYPNRDQAFTGKGAFREWYADVLGQYFDETHQVEAWDIQVEGPKARVKVVVRWERRSWKPREARSRYEASLSKQSLELVRSPDGRLLIHKKIVETFEPTAPIFAVGA